MEEDLIEYTKDPLGEKYIWVDYKDFHATPKLFLLVRPPMLDSKEGNSRFHPLAQGNTLHGCIGLSYG
jgi:hypothetical protein